MSLITKPTIYFGVSLVFLAGAVSGALGPINSAVWSVAAVVWACAGLVALTRK